MFFIILTYSLWYLRRNRKKKYHIVIKVHLRVIVIINISFLKHFFSFFPRDRPSTVWNFELAQWLFDGKRHRRFSHGVVRRRRVFWLGQPPNALSGLIFETCGRHGRFSIVRMRRNVLRVESMGFLFIFFFWSNYLRRLKSVCAARLRRLLCWLFCPLPYTILPLRTLRPVFARVFERFFQSTQIARGPNYCGFIQQLGESGRTDDVSR